MQRNNYRILRAYLSPLDCCNKNTIDWIACKEQEFISHSSGGWKVQVQGIGKFSVW